jgi:RNA polymerase sigma-70 factor (sigma-E family)
VDRIMIDEGSGPAGAQRSSFAVFYRSEYPSAVRLARLLVPDASAEDLAQEAFSRLHGRFEAIDNPPAYLRRTLVNLGRTWHRRRIREQDRLGQIPRPETVELGAGEMLDAIDALPYRQKAVMVLRYWLDLSEAEIADVLGCRAGTVKSLAARALRRLRKAVDE